MATYTSRQQQIIDKLGKSMGFTSDQVIDVTLQADIPVAITYRSSTGQFTRQTYNELGPILTNAEMTAIREINATTNAALSASFATAQALLGRSLNGIASDLIQSTGRQAIAGVVASSGVFNPSIARLTGAGLGTISNMEETSLISVTFNGPGNEDRVRISDPTGLFINSGNPVLKPLSEVGYVLFPYTPSISRSHTANYQTDTPTHSNYSYPMYQNSPTSNIEITAQFTAKDSSSAAYVIAVQHFFMSVTKMFYGTDSEAGLPPPILRLDGHGEYQFKSVPIVITGFSMNYPTDVDYITTTIAGKETKVPVMQEFSISTMPIYSRKSISQEFGLKDFASGKLLGSAGGRGSFV